VPWKQQTSSRPPEEAAAETKRFSAPSGRTQPNRRGEPHRSWNGGARDSLPKRHPHRERRQRQKKSSPERTPPERIDYSPAKWCHDGHHPRTISSTTKMASKSRHRLVATTLYTASSRIPRLPTLSGTSAAAGEARSRRDRPRRRSHPRSLL